MFLKSTRVPCAVFHPPLVEDLEEDLVHVGVRLFDLVEKTTLYGRRRTASVSTPPSPYPT